MSFTEWLWEGTKEGASKLKDVGLGVFEQLNRPTSAVVTTAEEVGKGIGRTAASVVEPLTRGERPELGEAFTPEEKATEDYKREAQTTLDVITPFAEATKAVAKTVAAPVKGFIQNTPAPDIIQRNIDVANLPSIDTAKEQINTNVEWFNKLKEAKPEDRPAIIKDLKAQGGLEVTKDGTNWFKDMVSTKEGGELVSELVGAGALVLDPLLHGGGILTRTPAYMQKAKTTEGVAPTIIDQLAAGERQLFDVGRVESPLRSFESWLGIAPEAQKTGRVVEGINYVADSINEFVRTKSQSAFSKLNGALEGGNIPLMPETLDIIDSVRKAVFNRSANKDYNKVQELLINGAKVRTNTAEEFIKSIEEYVNAPLIFEGTPIEEVQRLSDVAITSVLGGKEIRPLSEASNLIEHTPKILDAIDNPTATLFRGIDNEAPVMGDLHGIEDEIIDGYANEFADFRTDYFSGNQDAEASLRYLIDEGYISEQAYRRDSSGAMREAFIKAANETFAKLDMKYRNSMRVYENLVRAGKTNTVEARKLANFTVSYRIIKSRLGDNPAVGILRAPNTFAEAIRVVPEISKEFGVLPANVISKNRFFKNLISTEATDSAKKYKYNPENIVADAIDNIEAYGQDANVGVGLGVDIIDEGGAVIDRRSWIQELNRTLGEHPAFKDVPTDPATGLKNIVMDDPVRTLTSAGLGLGAKEWLNKIVLFVYNESRKADSSLVKQIDEAAPEGFVSLAREGYPQFAVADDLYKPISDAMGKIVGTPEPETMVQRIASASARLWKKSVLAGLFGEGYGYAVRNITSETLKSAQSGINAMKELTGLAANQVAKLVGADEILRGVLPDAVQSIIDKKPMVRNINGQEVDIYDLAKKYSVIDSGLFEEEILQRGGKISDKIKITFKEPTDMMKMRHDFAIFKKSFPNATIEEEMSFADDLWKAHNNGMAYEGNASELLEMFMADSPLTTEIMPIQTKQGVIDGFLEFDGLGANEFANNSENTARLTVFAKAIEDGYSPEAAARLVNDTSFNYRDISEEAKAVKLMIPFLTFYLKNIPFQVGKFFSEPKVHRLLGKGLEITLPSNEELEQMPDYIREQLPVNFGKFTVGIRQYLAQTQGGALAELGTEWFKNMAGYDNKFWKQLENNLTDVVGALNPAIKLPIELGTGKEVPGSSTPLGDTGGNVLGMDMPIQRYSGESAQYIPGVSKKAEHTLFSLIPPARKIATLASQASEQMKGVRPSEDDMLGRPTNIPVINSLLKYTTGIGAKMQPSDVAKKRDKFDKLAIRKDIYKIKALDRSYRKQYKEGKITEEAYKNHKSNLKDLEKRLRQAYRQKTPKLKDSDAAYLQEIEAINEAELSVEPKETAESEVSNETLQFLGVSEQPVVEQSPQYEENFEKGLDKNINIEYNNNKPTNFESWIMEENNMPKEYGEVLKSGDLEGNPKGYTPNDIQKLFDSVGSWMASYDVEGTPLSEWIVDLANKYDINPLYMVALMQKEQSAVERKNMPGENVMRKIVGYGYTEEGKREDAPNTFTKQLEAAAKQLRRYDTWSPVKKMSKVKLYDKAPDGGKILTPSNIDEAKSLLYNPRWEGLSNQANIIRKYEQIIGR